MRPSTSENSAREALRQQQAALAAGPATREPTKLYTPDGQLWVPVLDIYARLSYARGGETIQVDDQKAKGRAEIPARGGQVGEVFTDNSKSAWRRDVVRQQWLQMMERLESGESDGFWVWDLYRFSRKVMEGERILALAEKGLLVWSHAGEYNLTTADGRKQFRDAIGAATAESDKISERVNNGKKRQVEKGYYRGGLRAYAMPGLAPADPNATGWRGKVRTHASVERVDAERDIVRECMDRLLPPMSESVNSVVKDLNARGAAGERAALPVSGMPWRHEMLVRSLCRPAMAGLLKYRGEIVGELADIEEVVDRETWDKFVAMTAARKTGRPPSSRHMLTTTMTCGRCRKATMQPYSGATGSTHPDGTPRRTYRCPSPNTNMGRTGGCGRNVIDADIAEQAVERALLTRLSDPRRAELVTEELAQVRSRRAEIIAQIEQWEQEGDALTAKTARWGVARVDRAMEPILRNVDQLRAQLAQLGDDDDMFGTAVGDAIEEWKRVRADGDAVRLRQIIRRVFPNLTVAEQSRRGDHSPARILYDGPADDPADGPADGSAADAA